MALPPRSDWFIVPAPKTPPRLRLFCFAYAGGTAAQYAPWVDQLDDSIELVAVQLPGRANRLFEAPYHSMTPLVKDLATAMTPWLTVPYAFFGHSLGSRVALSVAQHLAQHNIATPEYFIASGSNAPHLSRPKRNVWSLPTPQFIDELKRLNGTPAEILQNKELMELHLPMLRADFRLADTRFPVPQKTLRSTAWVFAGVDDIDQPEEELLQWGDFFDNRVRLEMFEGAHFFVDTQRAEVVRQVNNILTAASPRAIQAI
ncbi:MAG: thioesterase II family protein [Gammaproteobacteria bacterium]